MDLVLVRHAKSLYNDYVQSDIERHLAERGYRDAHESAAWCLENSLVPDLIISSPAIRAFSTALIFANHFSYAPDRIQLHSSVYEAEVRQLMYVAGEVSGGFKKVMMFGHNPGFTDFLNVLCGPVCVQLPTAAVAHIRLKIKDWKEISPDTGELISLYSGHKPF